MNLNTNIRVLMVLLAMLLPASLVCAQFVSVNLEISPKFGVETSEPLALLARPNAGTGSKVLEGIKALQLTANENMVVLASVSQDITLVNGYGEELPLTTWLAYLIGDCKPPELLAQQPEITAMFSMSHAKLLIQKRNPNPIVMATCLTIGVTVVVPQPAITPYKGSIYVTLELN